MKTVVDTKGTVQCHWPPPLAYGHSLQSLKIEIFHAIATGSPMKNPRDCWRRSATRFLQAQAHPAFQLRLQVRVLVLEIVTRTFQHQVRAHARFEYRR